MKKKQRVIAGAGLAAGLVAGGGAGLLIGASSGSAGAAPVIAVTDPSTPADSTPAASTPAATTPAKPVADREAARRQLQPLVDDGTITAAQLDAIVAKLANAPTGAPGPGRGFGGGPGRAGGMRGILGGEVDAVATTLGISADDVRTALRDGTTLKSLAESKGKTAQDVIDALVAATKKQLDAKVADGSITQAEADTMLAAATVAIPGLVDNGIPKGMAGRPGGDHRHGDAGVTPGGTPSSTPTPASSPSTTTG